MIIEKIAIVSFESDPKTYSEMRKLVDEHFSEKGGGWSSGFRNFIKYVRGEEVY
jgi:hypothetical protein